VRHPAEAVAESGGRVIELSDLIRGLRQEFVAALAEGDGEPVRFELGAVELEMTVAVNREAGGNGKIRFLVVDADGSGKYSHSQTQRITVSLQPKAVAADGTTRTPLIGGGEAGGER
jgi:hypothetical protein